MMWLAAVLLLQPVLAEEGEVRLVAAGVGRDEVVWHVDGVEIARTGDREAATAFLAAGEHEVAAHGPAGARWQALARLDGPAAGAAYVPAWTAVHEPVDAPRGSGAIDLSAWPVALAVAAVGLAAWPRRRGLEARRRARR